MSFQLDSCGLRVLWPSNRSSTVFLSRTLTIEVVIESDLAHRLDHRQISIYCDADTHSRLEIGCQFVKNVKKKKTIMTTVKLKALYQALWNAVQFKYQRPCNEYYEMQFNSDDKYA